MIRLQRFDHIGITSRDVETSIAFYRDLFGMEVVPGGPPHLRSIRSGTVEIAISPARSGDGAATRSPGDHVAFRVDPADFEAVKRILDERAVSYENNENRIYLRDPDGYLLEMEFA